MLTREQQAEIAGVLDAFAELERTVATAVDAEPWKRVPEAQRKEVKVAVHEFIASGRRMLAAMSAVQESVDAMKPPSSP
jgi:hypothetical protein